MVPKVSAEYKEERKSALMQSALHCFAEKGYEVTTVDDIVRHAGVSKGLVYTYFSSKEEIFLEILKNRTDKFFAQIQERFQSITTARDKLLYLLDGYRKSPLSKEQREWITVSLEFFLSSSRSPARLELMEKRYESFLTLFREIVKEGQEKGEFRPDVEPDAASRLFWALCDGIDR